MPLIQSFPPVDGQTVQAEVLPTAGAAQLDKIYQYVGTTTPQYVNGYYYKCIYNNPNYEWVNVLVQPEADPDPSVILTGTILANGWSSNAQTVTVNDFDPSTPGTIGLLNTVTGEQYAAAANAGLRVTAIANNLVTFSCEEIPEIDIPFGILIPGTTVNGGGGTTDYTYLDNKPQIANVTLQGNKSLADLGIASADDVDTALATKVDKVAGKGLSTNDYSNEDKTIVDGISTALALKADKSEIPENTSDLVNDSGFITNTINNLTNYYLKSQTYTQAEVDTLIAAAKNGRFISVATLPTTNIDVMAIYLVPSDDPEAGNIKDEYINMDGTSAGWELIGSTAIDLSGYVTDEDLTAALADYMKKSVYDSDLAVANAGGISAFVSDAVSDSEKDIYAVMGEMGAKNLIPYPYYETTKTQNGVTFTDNGDGSVTVVTTAGGATNHSRFYLKKTTDDFCFEKGKTYVLTDKVADGGSSNYKTEVALYNGSTYIGTAFSTVNGSVEFTLPNNDTYDRVSMYITVYKNQVITTPITFKPMLRLASDTDDTYQRYAKTNKQLTDEIANKVDKVAGKGLSTNDYDDTEKGKVADNTGAIEAIVNEYGAKNLLPNNATSQTINGVTFTVNADGSITANGTATNDVYSYLIENISIPSGKEVIVTGCPSGGSVETFYMTTMNVQQQWNDAADYGDGDSTSNGVIKVSIVIRNGYTANNLTFYPMIRDARITDPTYVPYAMTNKELTEKVKGIYHHRSLLTANGGTESINISALDIGRAYIVMCSGNYNPLWRYMGLLCITDGSNGYLYDIVTDGTLTVSVSGNTLTLTNNNHDNAQVVGTTIMG